MKKGFPHGQVACWAFRSVTLVAGAVLSTGCVILLPDEETSPQPEKSPLIESIQIEGLEFSVRTVDAIAITNSVAHASGYSTSYFCGYTPRGGTYSGGVSTQTNSSGSSTSVTAIIGTHTSYALLGMAVHHLENQRVARVVNSKVEPALIIQGSVNGSESIGAAWSVPFNVVMVFGLVLPQTWGERFSVSLRAYNSDGEFLKQYEGTADARTFHHWVWRSRLSASEERKAAGFAVATLRALNALKSDLKNGTLRVGRSGTRTGE